MSRPPICVSCRVEMGCAKNEFVVADPEPSTYWSGDLYECPGCHARVVTGFGAPFTDEAMLPPEGVSLRFWHSWKDEKARGGRGGGQQPIVRSVSSEASRASTSDDRHPSDPAQDLPTFEDDGCGCRFRYGSDGSFKVLQACTYHETPREDLERLRERAHEARELLLHAFVIGDGVSNACGDMDRAIDALADAAGRKER